MDGNRYVTVSLSLSSTFGQEARASAYRIGRKTSYKLTAEKIREFNSFLGGSRKDQLTLSSFIPAVFLILSMTCSLLHFNSLKLIIASIQREYNIIQYGIDVNSLGKKAFNLVCSSEAEYNAPRSELYVSFNY